MIYFTSDLHFGHKNIIRHAHRPFSSVEEMNNKMINKWNDLISFDDDVYILGDVTLKGGQFANEMLSQLKGKKYLIRGNHDGFVEQQSFIKEIFIWIKDYAEILYNNNYFILSHYPFLGWNGMFKGNISLHGHQHNHSEYNIQNRQQKINRYDVGVDANNFTPVSADEIICFF